MTSSANRTGCNLLLITSDQHNPFICGYADSPVQTPALDQMAAGGATFAAAYTNDPVCMPARATLATGRYGSATGNYDNGTPYAGDEADSWGHRLTEQGKAAVTFGKLHFAPEGDSGYQTHLPLQASRGYGAAVMGWARGDAPFNDMMVRHALDARAGRAEYADYDRHTTRSACRWLTSEAPMDAPWAAHVSYAYPHYPFRTPVECAPPDHVDIPLPPAWEQGDWPENAELAARRRIMGIDQRPLSADELRALHSVYFGMVNFVDRQIADLLAALEASGAADRTVVIYTTDHGDMLGSHGLLMKSVMYDASARVPFVMTGPGVDAGTVCSTPVSLADIFPTVLAVTGTQPEAADAELPGSSLLELAGSAPDERAVFSEYHGPTSTAASYMIRKGRHKLVTHMHPDAASQLFDMDADPFEVADLIDDPTMYAVVADLDAELRSIVDPEALDTEIRASQAAELERAGGADGLRPPPVLPRTAYGTIALGWSIPPSEIMAEVAHADSDNA
ncbi:sulfatase-like hydrolase/transferase [Candidatus Poriferisodalis sp.]|uniref:sulfatase-like hydrolase/transferase n=1 Tax=Candidatus Poriferisodalis sp. TaxID=3101277 RepID=UPI003B012337